MVISDDVVLTKRNRGGFRAFTAAQGEERQAPAKPRTFLSPLVPKHAYFQFFAITHWTILRTFVEEPGVRSHLQGFTESAGAQTSLTCPRGRQSPSPLKCGVVSTIMMVRCQQLCATRYGSFGFREEALPRTCTVGWGRSEGLEFGMMIAMAFYRSKCTDLVVR